jgi:hypothetical protein
MALPPEVGDREVQKFVETDAGDVAVRVQDANINGLDSGNSTTVELPTNQEFKGTWIDVTSYQAVQVSLSTENRGTLFMEWSSSNTDTASDAAEFIEDFDVPGGKQFLIRRNHRAQYYRTRYLNNGFGQTKMILSTFLGEFNAPKDAVRLRDEDGNEANMLLQDGDYTLSSADRTTQVILGNILDQLIYLNEKIDIIME